MLLQRTISKSSLHALSCPTLHRALHPSLVISNAASEPSEPIPTPTWKERSRQKIYHLVPIHVYSSVFKPERPPWLRPSAVKPYSGELTFTSITNLLEAIRFSTKLPESHRSERLLRLIYGRVASHRIAQRSSTGLRIAEDNEPLRRLYTHLVKLREALRASSSSDGSTPGEKQEAIIHPNEWKLLRRLAPPDTAPTWDKVSPPPTDRVFLSGRPRVNTPRQLRKPRSLALTPLHVYSVVYRRIGWQAVRAKHLARRSPSSVSPAPALVPVSSPTQSAFASRVHPRPKELTILSASRRISSHIQDPQTVKPYEGPLSYTDIHQVIDRIRPTYCGPYVRKALRFAKLIVRSHREAKDPVTDDIGEEGEGDERLRRLYSHLLKLEEDAVASVASESPSGPSSLSGGFLSMRDEDLAMLSRLTRELSRRTSSPGAHQVEPESLGSEMVDNGTLGADGIEIKRLKRGSNAPPVPTLAHGLDRVLFNPSPYMLRDPHSHVFNFPARLGKIPPIDDFVPERLSPFQSPSQHEELQQLARKHHAPFAGSTSSLSALLSHMYFLVSGNKEVNMNQFSKAFFDSPKTFTPAAKMPDRVKMHFKNGVYAIDSDQPKNPDSEILLRLGTMLEHFLTHDEKAFRRLTTADTSQFKQPDDQAYQYSQASNLMMRSQLDCYDPRLPGTGVFDLKTRAVVAIRRDITNHENNGYVIRRLVGAIESYEREQYDLLRSGLLHYFFQARIGNMDGIFIAYHNTQQIFGFQYVPLDEMDFGLFGSPGVGDRIFHVCIGLLNKLLDKIKECSPKTSCSVVVENAQDGSGLRAWIQELDENGETNPALPVHALHMTLEHTLMGRPVDFARFRESDWKVKYTIERISPSESTRAGRDGAIRRIDKISTSGTSIVGPSAAHSLGAADIDAPGASSQSDRDSPSKSDSAAEEDEGNPSTSDVIPPHKKTPNTHAPRPRPPAPFVSYLRKVSMQGREYTRNLEHTHNVHRYWNQKLVRAPTPPTARAARSKSRKSSTRRRKFGEAVRIVATNKLEARDTTS